MNELERQSELLAEVAKDLRDDRTEQRRATRITRVAIIVATVLSLLDLGALGLIIQGNRQIKKNQGELRTLVDNAEKNARTGLTKNGYALALEIDCRNRRAIAHMTSPPPGTSCVEP